MGKQPFGQPERSRKPGRKAPRSIQACIIHEGERGVGLAPETFGAGRSKPLCPGLRLASSLEACSNIKILAQEGDIVRLARRGIWELGFKPPTPPAIYQVFHSTLLLPTARSEVLTLKQKGERKATQPDWFWRNLPRRIFCTAGVRLSQRLYPVTSPQSQAGREPKKERRPAPTDPRNRSSKPAYGE